MMDNGDEVEAETTSGTTYEVADPATGEIRVCAVRCATCVYHRGNLMDLRPGRLADMVREARRSEGHIVCHATLGTRAAAICRGFADADHGTSLALRLGHALGTLHHITPPATPPDGPDTPPR